MATLRNAMVRIGRAWRALATVQRHAAVAALALLATMVLPWYEETFVSRGAPASRSLTAFNVLSWVEAAIFLVSLGVLLLLFFRAEQRAFHLPGGDGTVIMAAGLWAAFLFLWRVFDRPNVSDHAATVGVQWGFFFAFIAAGALAYAGYRIRIANQAEPTAAQDPTTRVEPAPPRREYATAATRPAPRRRPRRTASPDAPTTIAGQLSFEESADDDR